MVVNILAFLVYQMYQKCFRLTEQLDRTKNSEGNPANSRLISVKFTNQSKIISSIFLHY